MSKSKIEPPPSGFTADFGGSRLPTPGFKKHFNAVEDTYSKAHHAPIRSLKFLHHYSQKYGDWVVKIQYTKPRKINVEWICITNRETGETRIHVILNGKQMLSGYNLKPRTSGSKRYRLELIATHFFPLR